MYGGGQEMGWRPGTLPVPLVVGLGASAELAGEEYLQRRQAAAAVKERFLQALSAIEHTVNGDPTRTHPHVVNVSFTGIDSEALMMAVREELAISNGAACTSANYSPSHVLKAMGLPDESISSAVRISWGPGITHIPAEPIIAAVQGMRE
jgi:cysteine desulfurase